MKDYISKNFELAFGQHSGVIDVNKEKFELPRFPINENYGELKRFKSIINSFPLEYKRLIPEEKKINDQVNPPIKFREPFKPRRGRINCSLNDGGKWRWFGVQFIIAKN